MDLPRRKQARWKPGMVYAVPLKDDSFGLAQAGEAQGEFANVIYVALFDNRFLQLPPELPPLARENALSLSATWRQTLNRGDWISLGIAPEVFRTTEFPNDQYKNTGYIGAKNYDSGLLADFLSACHGLVPWNTMHDPTYFDSLLKPGVRRPDTALVLGEADREVYRREVLGVGA